MRKRVYTVALLVIYMGLLLCSCETSPTESGAPSSGPPTTATTTLPTLPATRPSLAGTGKAPVLEFVFSGYLTGDFYVFLDEDGSGEVWPGSIDGWLLSQGYEPRDFPNLMPEHYPPKDMQSFQLTPEQIETLAAIYDRISSFNPSEMQAFDAFYVQVKLGTIWFGQFTYGLAEDENADLFIEKLLPCLPILQDFEIYSRDYMRED